MTTLPTITIIPYPIEGARLPIKQCSQCLVSVARAATLITAGGGRFAVVDVVEAVLKLLTGHGRTVGPEAFAADELTEGVILVGLVGRIRLGSLGSLISGVVLIAEVHRRSSRGNRGDVGEAVQQIVLFGRDQALDWAIRK
jgi:hypothetical protein